MITIQEIREKYPQYKDMSDTQLADSLHSKHYSDLDKEDFYNRIGLNKQDEKKSSFLGDSANTLLNAIIGAGDAATNLPKNLHNLLTPQSMNVPIVDRNLGQGYGLGKVGGDIADFLFGSHVAGGTRLAAESAPYVNQIAKSLGGEGVPGLARRAIGSAGYGAIQNPDERGEKALESGGLSVFLDSLGGVGKLGKKIPEALNYFNPEKYSNQIGNLTEKAGDVKDRLMELLGSGKTLEENKKGLARDIKNAYGMRKNESRELYRPVLEEHGAKEIPYEGYMGNLRELAKDKGIEMENFFKKVEGYDPDLNSVHKSFMKSPTLQNAHDLQSQLGTSIRKLENLDKKGNLSRADTHDLSFYKDMRTSLKDDIDKYLSSNHPAEAEKYKEATKHYLENVVPYTSSTNLSKISKGELTNPSVNALVNLFKNPQEGTNNTISKIVNDLGPEAHKKILFSELGKYDQSNSPESLISNLFKLDEKGLGSYSNERIKGTHENLNNIFNEIEKLKNLESESKKGLGGFVKRTVGKFVPKSIFETANRTNKDSVSPLYELAKKLLISNI